MPPRALAGLLLVLACGPSAAPQPGPTPAPEPATAPPTATAEPADGKPGKRVYTPEELDKIGPRPPPEPPLTQEELDLIAADPHDLTKEMRVKRAYAVRRKTLQNPDSPMARQIEKFRQMQMRGELPMPNMPKTGEAPNQSLPPEPPAKAP